MGENERDEALRKKLQQEDELKKQQQIDQGMAALADRFPALWRSMFLNLQKEGFTETQAMEILKAYVHQTNGLRTG